MGNFTLAVNRSYTNQNGEREADFIQCVIWRKAAENLANFTHKGSQIGITGRIQTRNYDNQQGQRVYVTEVVVEQFDLLDPREQKPHQDSYQTQSQSNNYHNHDTSYGVQDGTPVELSEEDLPF